MSQKITFQGVFSEDGVKFKFPTIELVIEENGCFKYDKDSIKIDGSINQTTNACNFVYNKNSKKIIIEGTIAESTLKGKWAYDTNNSGELELMLEGFKPHKKEVFLIDPVPYGKKKGFYMEEGEKHDMELELGLLDDGVFIGKGKDDIGEFEMTGAFSKYDSNEVNITKQYLGKHQVMYTGVYENKIIKGLWITEDTIGEEFEISMATE